jgi:hypothetical protein
MRATAMLLPYLLLTGAGCNQPAAAPESTGLTRIGGRGEIDYVVASPRLLEQRVDLQDAVKRHCAQGHPSACIVHVWPDSRSAPIGSALEWTAEQEKAEVAMYVLNRSNGHECYSVFENGERIAESPAGCNGPEVPGVSH